MNLLRLNICQCFSELVSNQLQYFFIIIGCLSSIIQTVRVLKILSFVLSVLSLMGNKSSKVVEVDNVEYHLSHCETIKTINSDIYGQLHLVRYNQMEFYLGESKTGQNPDSCSLHYLVPPEILVIPQFNLLEQSSPKSIEELIAIMEGVAELCQKTIVGISHNRVAHAGKWGLVGEYQQNWQFEAIMQNPQSKGIYLSPQQMMILSNGGDISDCDLSKADMFALGIILIQIIFAQQMNQIFDYENFEIKLKPLLIKLNTLRQEFGDHIYQIFLKMLELDEQQRIDFDELLQMLADLKNQSKMQSSFMTNSNSSYNSNYCRPMTNTRSPLKKQPSQIYRNDVSPLRGGKFLERGATPKKNGRTPERNTRSPIRRDLRINSRFEKQNTVGPNLNGNFTSRSPYKPMLLRKGGVSPLSRR